MNTSQFLLFFIFFGSVLTLGCGIFIFLRKPASANRLLDLGESLLLGSILLVGLMLFFSIIGLYRPMLLWTLVALGYAPLLFAPVQERLINLCKLNFHDPLNLIGLAVVGWWLFRNCFFEIDVDTITVYLLSQKVWLHYGTSILRDHGLNFSVFFPQFDMVPAALGIGIFPDETLFPQLIQNFWRAIIIILVWGYVKERWGKISALAAILFILLNDHFYYSGANNWVLINAPIAAFMFASAYNFWESREEKGNTKFILAIVYAVYMFVNKYQALWIILGLFVIGAAIQPSLRKKIKNILGDQRGLIFLVGALALASLWLMKNWISTGTPLFPGLAGKFSLFGWSPEMGNVFDNMFGGISLLLFIKYMNFFFIWPGVAAAKWVLLLFIALPFTFFLQLARGKSIGKEGAVALYWILLCVIAVLGLSLVSHTDPRYYRYPIALYSVGTIAGFHYLGQHFFRIKKTWIVSVILLALSLPGYRLMVDEGGPFNRPKIVENWKVLKNELHTADIVERYHPGVALIKESINKSPEKFAQSAYWVSLTDNYPLFFLPIRPIAGLFRTTIIEWKSYDTKETIVKDLENYGLKYIIDRDSAEFIPLEKFAAKAVTWDRSGSKIYSDYGYPKELVER